MTQVLYKTPEKPLDANWTVDFVVLEYTDKDMTIIKSVVATTPTEELAIFITNELPDYRKYINVFRIY